MKRADWPSKFQIMTIKLEVLELPFQRDIGESFQDHTNTLLYDKCLDRAPRRLRRTGNGHYHYF